MNRRLLPFLAACFIVSALFCGMAAAQCGVPVFSGHTYSSNGSFSSAYLAYLHGPYRQWCYAHGGSIDNIGNCRNWKCGSTSASSHAGSSASSRSMQNAIVLDATQQILDSFFASFFTPSTPAKAQQDAAQKEQQAQEQARQILLEQKHKQEILERLSGEMKWSNGPAPTAQNDSSAADLQLKLSDPISNPADTHASPAGQEILVGGMRLKPSDDASSASSGKGVVQPHTTYEPAATSTTDAAGENPDRLAKNVPAGSGNISAYQQLQLIAGASGAAASALTPEDAAAKARYGFDTGATEPSGSLPLVTKQATVQSIGNAPPQPAQNLPSVSSSSVIASITPPPGTGNAAMAGIASGAPIFSAPLQNTVTSEKPPSRIAQMTDEQLQTEACRARKVLLDISTDAQKSMHEMEKMEEEIKDTREEAVKEGMNCLSEFAVKAIDDGVTHHANLKPKFKDIYQKVRDTQSTYSALHEEYEASGKAREEKLEALLSSLKEIYELIDEMHGKESLPWVDTAQCTIKFSYLASKVYLEEQQLKMITANIDGSAGSLKAEKSVAEFQRKLVEEAKRRGVALGEKNCIQISRGH